MLGGEVNVALNPQNSLVFLALPSARCWKRNGNLPLLWWRHAACSPKGVAASTRRRLSGAAWRTLAPPSPSRWL